MTTLTAPAATTTAEVLAKPIRITKSGMKITVRQGNAVLGVIWDEGDSLARSRFSVWSPKAGTHNGIVGFRNTLPDAISAIAKTHGQTYTPEDAARADHQTVGALLTATVTALGNDWAVNDTPEGYRVTHTNGLHVDVTAVSAPMIEATFEPGMGDFTEAPRLLLLPRSRTSARTAITGELQLMHNMSEDWLSDL